MTRPASPSSRATSDTACATSRGTDWSFASEVSDGVTPFISRLSRDIASMSDASALSTPASVARLPLTEAGSLGSPSSPACQRSSVRVVSETTGAASHFALLVRGTSDSADARPGDFRPGGDKR
jgi:hypothetical protein